MKKVYALALGLMAFATTSNAQVQIGCGSNTSQPLPVNNFYGYTYSQSIYLQGEIGTSGNITSIDWYFQGSGIPVSDSITIYMGHTTKTEFSGTSDWEPLSNLTQVFVGTIPGAATLSTGWVTLTLATPFAYNNTDNLVIAVDENRPGYDSSSDDYHCSPVSGNRSIYFYNDGTNPDPASPPTSGFSLGVSSFVPNVILGGLTNTCPSITALDTIVANYDTIAVSWTAGGTETEWEVQYGPGGFTLGTGTINSVTATGDTLLNPTDGVTDFYVRPICGGDTGVWSCRLTVVLPVLNDTMCAAIAIPTDLSTRVYSTIGAATETVGGNTLHSAVWFKTAVPASGNLAVNTCGSDMPYVALRLFTSSDCSEVDSAVQIGYASHWTNPFSCSASGRAGIELCGLTPGDTVYIAAYRPYSWGSYPEGVFNIQAWDPTYGSGTVTDFVVCYTDSVNLQGQVTGQSTNPYANFVWNYPNNPTAIANDTIFVAGNATPAGDSLFYYPTNGCSRDTIGLMLEVKGASNAGEDGTMPACKGQQINLLEGLGGTADLGGTWYNPSNTALPSGDIISGAIPGSYNYTYVTNNGYCANDSSVVTVVVSDCWYVGIEEVELANVSIFPNPTNEMVYITNFGSNEVFNFEVVDLNGRVVTSQENAINGTETTEVSLSNVEKGIYLVRIFNGTAEKTYRVVKQ